MLGFTIDDVNLNALSKEDFLKIRKLIPEHGVVLIKNQNLTIDSLVKITHQFGEPVLLPEGLRFKNVEKSYPEIARVSNILADGTLLKNHKAAEYWHSDGDFWQPGRNFIFNILYSEVVPKEGGQTGFVDLRDAYESLPSQIKLDLEEKSVLVCCDDIPDFIDAKKEERQPDARHKVKHTHIETGRIGLYFGHTKASIDSVSEATSNKIMNELVKAIENPAIQYIHEWEKGDVLIWDNTSVMHRGMGGYANYPRVLFRTQAFVKPNLEFAQNNYSDKLNLQDH